MDYGGGIETLIGVASVAVPGTPAALHLASQRFGHIGWRDLLAPVIRATRSGFPLSAACHYYLKYSGDIIFGHSEDGHSALHDREGDLLDVRNNIVVPHLADSLTASRKTEAGFSTKVKLHEQSWITSRTAVAS